MPYPLTTVITNIDISFLDQNSYLPCIGSAVSKGDTLVAFGKETPAWSRESRQKGSVS